MSDDDADNGTVEPRRSRHTTKFDRLNGHAPKLFGKRPHLAKGGREIANAAAEKVQRENPEWADPDDVSLEDVLKWLDRDGNGVREKETDTLCDLLTKGLTFREAVTFYLYEHAGLTLREIYHVDEGKQRSFSREDDRQAERNVAATIQSAARKLDYDVQIAIE